MLKKCRPGYRTKTVGFVCLCILLLSIVSTRIFAKELSALLSVSSLAEDAQAQNADGAAGQKPYPAVGISAGVWNDGQAALWDLNITDHFHVFGPVERARGHKPEQPIKFSHVRHVQKNKIECQFCHWNVAKSPYAAIPEVQTCVGCHNHKPPMAFNLGTDETQKAEIGKIKDYYDKGEPIPWVKVHVMPDYVRFNHKRHVKAGVACQSCHGQIPEMETVERVSSMKMGWCVSCHRAQGTSIDCNTCHY